MLCNKWIAIILGLVLALCLFSVPAAAAIGYASSTNNLTTTTSLTFTNILAQTDDLLLAHIVFNGGSDDTVTAPDGTWHLINRTNNGDDIGEAIYYKVVTATGTNSYTWTLNYGGNGARAVGGIMRYTGVNTTSPIFGSSSNSGNGDDLTALGINVVPAGSLLVACFGFDDQEDDFNVPSNMTWNYVFEHTDGDGPSCAAARENWTSGGNTGSRTSFNGVAVPDADWVANLIALREAATPTGSVSGYKIDSDNNRLNGWNITLRNTTTLTPVYFNVTHTQTGFGAGYYNITGVPYGTYWLNETLEAGWTQVSANRTVQINATTPRLFNQNFTNSQIILGNISGYKRNATGTGLGGWQITLTNQTNGIFLTCKTASNGSYFFGNLPLYSYQLNETLQASWIQDPATPNRVVQINTTTRSLTNQNFTNMCPPPTPPPPEGNLTIIKTVNPSNINISGSSCFPQNTTVTLSITGYGCGNPACGANSSEPLDIIFAIDSSGSMCGDPPPGNDPTGLRLTGAKEFIGEMNASKDQVGVINWDTSVNNPTYPPAPYPPGLGNNFTAANQTIDMNTCDGFTCGECAVDRALEMMQNNTRCPNVNSTKAIILLTDGLFNIGGSTNASFNDEIALANSLNIRIYTIGLGSGVDPNLLTYIAQGTGGSYYFATNASVIADVYDSIFVEIISISSPSYVNVTEVLEPYIIVDQSSFNLTPNSSDIPNNTYIWTNISQYVGNHNQRLNGIETVNITFNVSSSQTGTGLPVNNGTAHVNYINSKGVPIVDPIPYANVTVNVSSCPGNTFCISGYKIDNCTGLGVPSWNVTVSNQTGQVALVTTDVSGYYQICNLMPGNYTVCEELQPGWTNLTALCQNATITNANMTNVNFTNTKLMCISGFKLDCNSSGLSGWQINLTNSTPGFLATTTTNATGYYQFCGLLPGQYNLSETLNPGFQAGTGPSNPVTLLCNTNLTNQNFTNTKFLCVDGYKLDCNGTGLLGWNITLRNSTGAFVNQTTTNVTGYYQFCSLLPGIEYNLSEELKTGYQAGDAPANFTLTCNEELGLQNFTNTKFLCIDGYKLDCNGTGLLGWNITLRNSTGAFVNQTTTNVTGYYQFCSLLPGIEYNLSEELKTGYQAGDAPANFTLTCNEELGLQNFTNTKFLCIDGYKLDCNGTGLLGWNITLRNRTGAFVNQTTTNATGYYQFCGLLPGIEYNLSEELKTGYQAGESPVNFTLTCNEELGPQNFTNTKFLCIDGYKLDCNGAGLPGWNITLRNSTGTFLNQTATNATGYYQICGLLPGIEYNLSEELKTGYQAGDAPANFTLTCNEELGLQNFTNTKFLCIDGYKLDCNGTGLPGWNITLRNSTGTFLNQTATNATGYYQICGLLPGIEYNLSEELKDEYQAGASPANFTLTCNEELGPQNFTNTKFLCVDGYKLDCNGTGLPGWNITLRNSTGTFVNQTTTNATGYYQICGLLPGIEYNLSEELKDGYQAGASPANFTLTCNEELGPQNFTNTKLLCISGYKLDNCTKLGLPGWNITLRNSTGAIIDTNVTDNSGYYQFCGLIPGNYNLTEILKDGYEAGDAPGPITLTCNENLTNQNFTNIQLMCISGYKLDDCTKLGLPGWNITLTNGTYTNSTTTNATGYYQFCGLVPGQYNLSETLKDGYQSGTGPSNPVTLLCSENLTNQNFTNIQLMCISGYKLDNCTKLGLPGWNITLTNGTYTNSTTTNATGYYQFCGLVPGQYNLSETLKDGYQAGTGPANPVTLLCSENLTNQNFTNIQLMCISGYKLDNCTKLGLPGWNITLTNGTYTNSTTTNATGYYQFCGLVPGQYNLSETLKDGYQSGTGPSNPVTLVCNTNLTNQNFTNIQLMCISGYKLDNCTKLGLPGWSITLTNGTYTNSTTTNATGYYQFCRLVPGQYNLTETLKDGYQSGTGPANPVTLVCNQNLTNQNFTNIQLMCISGYKLDNCTKLGLPGWNITLTNGTYTNSTTTNATGYYQFCGLVPGQYNLSETLKPGYQAGPGPSNPVTLVCNTNLTNQNFTNIQLMCISGYKLDNCTKLGLPGWNITLTNGTYTNSTTTNATGYYQFCGLVPGQYNLTETLKPGYQAGPGPSNPVTLVCNTNLTNQNFTNTQLMCISGYKLNSLTGQGLSGWNITLRNSTGGIIGTNVTDATGKYQVCGLSPGSYTVCEEVLCGWTNVTPTCRNVTLTCTNATGINFTNKQLLGNITGIKFNDLNGNGVRDVNEGGLSGWVINLRYPNGTIYATKTTGADGSFAFVNISWGRYNLSETLQSGWTQTKPAGNLYPVEINCTNLNVTGRDFGNLQNTSCCSCPTFAFFTTSNSGRTVTFTDTSTGNPVQWFWSFGDGRTSQLRNPQNIYARSGTYTVTENVKGMRCDGSTYWVSYKKSVKV